MGVRYGTFPRALAVVSGIFAAYLALVSLVSDTYGFVGSAIIMLIWGLLLKGLTFAYEPEHFKVLRGPERKKFEFPDVGPDEYPDTSALTASVLTPPKERTNRVLPGSHRQPVAQDRIIGKTHQDSDLESAEREEDRAWAEMFRAL